MGKGGLTFFRENAIEVNAQKHIKAELIFLLQVTVTIQRETVRGPVISLPIKPGDKLILSPTDGIYRGDGDNRIFDDSDNIDRKSARVNVVFKITLKLVDNIVQDIETGIFEKFKSVSERISPKPQIEENEVQIFPSKIIFSDSVITRFQVSARDTAAPGSQFAKVFITGSVKFSINGEYKGIKGRTTCYPWIQIRVFHLNRTIDNIKLLPKDPDNPYSLPKRLVNYQSGYWSE